MLRIWDISGIHFGRGNYYTCLGYLVLWNYFALLHNSLHHQYRENILLKFVLVITENPCNKIYNQIKIRPPFLPTDFGVLKAATINIAIFSLLM